MDPETELITTLQTIVGEEWVEVDAVVRDWSPLSLKGLLDDREGAALAVVRPATAIEVGRVIWACTEQGAPVVPIGARSGVLGGALPGGAIGVDLSRLDAIGEIDRENQLITVGAGVLGGVLEAHLREHGFTIGLYPQSLELASIGGWVATRASGTYSGHYGGVEDRLLGLEVVLADGTVCTTPVMPRWSIGPDMAGLFVGSEGTLGVITSVTLKIDRVPESTLLRAVRFPTVFDGLASIREIVQGGVHPAVVRLYDEAESAMLRATTQHDGDGAVLLLGFVGPTGVARAEEDFALAITVDHGGADLGREPAQRWDANRLRVPSGFVALQERGVLADYIDVQASWSTVETVYAAVRAALAAHCDTAVAHFSHVYAQGTSIYFVVSIRAASDEEAVARHRAAWQAAMEAVVLTGGGIAHHHGVGRVRTPWLHEEVMRGTGDLWSIVRTAFDPAATLSPDVLPHDPPGLVY